MKKCITRKNGNRDPGGIPGGAFFHGVKFRD